MRGDPATPCTALPPPTVASRDGQGHAVMTKAYQWRNGDLEKDDKARGIQNRMSWFMLVEKKQLAAVQIDASGMCRACSALVTMST
ncbi:unnamed protein product [Symbiodinium sp. CCMP2592]|nr:unnamed protein product [Symbiodinium sp. CCMP2592]